MPPHASSSGRLSDVKQDGAAIELSRVTKVYGEGNDAVTALRDVSFRVETGEIFGILGESGAGKSTLLTLLNRLERVTSGEVKIFGTDLATLSEPAMRQLRHRIGIAFQGFNLIGNNTVRQNVELPLRLQGIRDEGRVSELLDFVGLGDRGRHYPAELSGGQKQRVAIARALVTQPGILLLDEPTSALDLNTTRGILELILETQRRFNTTIAIVTHELDVVKAVCNRAALFERGTLRDILPVTKRFDAIEAPYIDHAREYLSE